MPIATKQYGLTAFTRGDEYSAVSDRDRFSYLGVNHADRLLMPKIKREGEWEIASWEEALNYVTAKIQKLISYFIIFLLGFSVIYLIFKKI